MNQPPPVALTIAGSDCSSGAGIQADLKTFQHFHVHGLTAVTCVVSETADVVRAVHPVPPAVVADQISLLLESFPVAAIKTGMLFSTEHILRLATLLRQPERPPLVVDPVMIASTGHPLLEPDAIDAYRNHLLPLARLITPNLHEAETLLGEPIQDPDALESAARRLSSTFGTAVLLKGGHLDGPLCLDILAEGSQIHHFSAPRIPLPGSHGTGCTFSAAITARLALGDPLAAAVHHAKAYLNDCLRLSYQFPPRASSAIHALNQGTLGFPQATSTGAS